MNNTVLRMFGLSKELKYHRMIIGGLDKSSESKIKTPMPSFAHTGERYKKTMTTRSMHRRSG